MRFDLIDQVLVSEPDRLVAIKNVTSAEEYLADHFPGFAVLPGVMMLETMAQAARRLLATRASHDPQQAGTPWVISSVRNVRYGTIVRPGQALRVEVTLRTEQAGDGQQPRQCEFQGRGFVGEDLAIQGRFTLAPLTHAGDQSSVPTV